MRKVILQEFVTIDGLAAGPNAGVDFIPESTTGDQSLERRQQGFLNTIDTIVLGRVTYQMFADYWPQATNDTDPIADQLNATPKFVLSRTLDRAPWGQWPEAKVVKADAAEAIAQLKRQPGKDVVIWGSISLAQSLMRQDIIDQYQLIVLPVVLGSGTPLFRDQPAKRGLKLLETKTFDRGSVLLSYG